MKSGTIAVILLLQTALIMGFLADRGECRFYLKKDAGEGYFPKCCNNCRSFSGAMFCDDVMDKCPPDCAWCRVVQVHPVKTFRCADGRTADGSCHPCKNH